MKNQRLDTPYIKIENEFKQTSWDDAYKIIVEKIKNTAPAKIAGITGDLTNMETLFIAKEFFNKTIKSDFLDSRPDNFYVNTNDRRNYIFNTSLNGLEESDLIILVGTNPRFEATMLNARIRKAYLKNKTKIISLGNVGDLTYPYEIVNNTTKEIEKIFDNSSNLSNEIKNSKNPVIIIGQSVLRSKSAKYIFEGFKKYLIENDKISDEWMPLNIISNHASTVGSYDLDIIDKNIGNNKTLELIRNNLFDVLFLIGQDELNIEKKSKFIIYIGSHGDKGAEIADVVLPGSAYTEQEGYFTNLEGKIQKAYKASYPPGSAKEDWLIFNELSALIKRKTIFKDKEELVDAMLNYLKINKKNNYKEVIKSEYVEEKIILDPIDYYYSNVISRSSKTMYDCRSEKINSKKTGTEG